MVGAGVVGEGVVGVGAPVVEAGAPVVEAGAPVVGAGVVALGVFTVGETPATPFAQTGSVAGALGQELEQQMDLDPSLHDGKRKVSGSGVR